MDLEAVIRGAGTCRSFRDEPVPDNVLVPILDLARFGPQGGNRQPVRWVVVRDRATKSKLGEWYLAEWEPYAANAAKSTASAKRRRIFEVADRMARNFAAIPVIVIVCAELASLHASDAALPRLSIVGGASVYPSVQNFLLGCRNAGLGAAITTLLCAREPEVKDLLGIPEGFATAAHLAVGYPMEPLPLTLHRRPLRSVVFSERFGEPLPGLEKQDG